MFVQERKVMADEDGSQIKRRKDSILRHRRIGRRSSTGSGGRNSGNGPRNLPSTSNAAGASVGCVAR